MNQPVVSPTLLPTTEFNPAVEAAVLVRISERLAHDCNNALAAILALGEDFQFHLEDGEPFPEGMKLLQDNIQRAGQVVQRLVELQKKSGPRQHLNLNELVMDSADLVRKFLPRNVQVVTDLAPEPLPVFADAAAFRRLIIELVWQVAESSPVPETLTCTTRRLTAPPTPGLVLTLTVSGTRPPAGKIFGPNFWHLKPFAERHGAAGTTGQNGTSFELWLPESDFSEPADA